MRFFFIITALVICVCEKAEARVPFEITPVFVFEELPLSELTNENDFPIFQDGNQPEPSNVLSIVRSILDEKSSDQERLKAIEANIELAPDLIFALVEQIKPGTNDESRRLSWIWEIAIRTGRKNDTESFSRVLEISLPLEEAKLHRWQAVVIGGGLVKGLSEINVSPRERILEIFKDDKFLQKRLRRTIRLAERMALDKSLSKGTRYDAIRILGLDRWENAKPVLADFLTDEADKDLKLAAIATLSDIDHNESTQWLLQNISNPNEPIRKQVFKGLLKSESRIGEMLKKIEESEDFDYSLLPKAARKSLFENENASIRERAKKLMPQEKVGKAKSNSKNEMLS